MNTSPHTSQFIEEMKQRLLEEKAQLIEELSRDASKEHGDYQAIYPDYGRHEDENASEVADYAALTATTEALEKRLGEVEAALGKIDRGTYGVMSDGVMIPEARLRANPAATTVVTK